jgi:hypothetical protein
VAASTPVDVDVAQQIARAMKVALQEKQSTRDEPIDITVDWSEKSRMKCYWCGYKKHIERDYHIKKTERPRRISGQESNCTAAKGLIKCFCCGKVGHHITKCKARVVFEGKEVVVDNKDIKQYAIQHPIL